MPREVRVTDNLLINDVKGNKVRSPHFQKKDKSITKTTTITRGGNVKKKIEDTSTNFLYGGEFHKGREINKSKYNKAGELKKKVTLTSEDGVTKKVVSRPGKDDVTKRVGLIAKAKLKKNI